MRSSLMDLDDMKKSLDCMKAEEIFELIEKAIDIAASQHPKELLQHRDRIVNMLLNTTHDDDDEKKMIDEGDNLWADFPPICEAEIFLTDVPSFDPFKLLDEINISDRNDDIEDNDHKSLNQNEHKINTGRKDFISPCSSSLTGDNSESGRCSKPQNSQSCKVTSSNSTKHDQNQQKACLAALDDATLQAKPENSKRKFTERQQQQQQEEKKRRRVVLIDDDIEDSDHKSMNQNEQRINTQSEDDYLSPCISLADNSQKYSKPQKSESCKVTSCNDTKQDQNQQKACLASLDDAFSPSKAGKL